MTQQNYLTAEQHHLAWGATRSCILECRQRSRAVDDHDGAELAQIALDQLERIRPERPSDIALPPLRNALRLVGRDE